MVFLIKFSKNSLTFLAAPVTSIINSSLHQGIVPDQWKISRITHVPKIFPPKHVESDVRPIAVTNAITKIAEKFVSSYFNDFYDAEAYAGGVFGVSEHPPQLRSRIFLSLHVTGEVLDELAKKPRRLPFRLA